MTPTELATIASLAPESARPAFQEPRKPFDQPEPDPFNPIYKLGLDPRSIATAQEAAEWVKDPDLAIDDTEIYDDEDPDSPEAKADIAKAERFKPFCTAHRQWLADKAQYETTETRRLEIAWRLNYAHHLLRTIRTDHHPT